jgi:hypothetical protein
MKMHKRFLINLVALCLLPALFQTPVAAAFSPHQGDSFNFTETINIGSGTGPDYYNYTEQTTTTGVERVNTIYPNGTVSAYYSFSWTTTNNQGLNEPGSSSGNYTFSSSNFHYIKGTDNQTGYGYVNPTVWFCMDNSLSQGGSFYLLNTLMTVKSTSYSYHLSSENRDVSTIYAQGISSYQRSDTSTHELFGATYTWNTYFDPTSGYVVGYSYNEQDTNSTTGDGFSYTDNLSVTSTSYALTAAPASYLGYIVIAAVIFVVIIIITVIVYAVSRRRRNRVPKNLFQQPPQQVPRQPPPQINLTPKEPPVQQIVVKEIVKVKCRYCGALIDATVQTCPFCGAPRT